MNHGRHIKYLEQSRIELNVLELEKDLSLRWLVAHRNKRNFIIHYIQDCKIYGDTDDVIRSKICVFIDYIDRLDAKYKLELDKNNDTIFEIETIYN